MPNWNRRRGQLQAYLAVIVDGEGSIGVYDLNNSYSARLTIAMQDPQAVGLFKRLYPEGTFTHRGPEYRIVYNQFKAYEILKDLIPFLIIKQQQAKVALSYIVHRRRDHQKKAANGAYKCERCLNAVETTARLKRRESKGVNSVNAMLSHELREYRAKPEEVEQDVEYILALLEGVETKLMSSTDYKAVSAPEQDIVQTAE